MWSQNNMRKQRIKRAAHGLCTGVSPRSIFTSSQGLLGDIHSSEVLR
jgi:hypothetical protein